MLPPMIKIANKKKNGLEKDLQKIMKFKNLTTKSLGKNI